MKKLCALILVTVSICAYSQNKVGFYVKLSPLFLKESREPLQAGGILAGGFRIGRYFATGIGGGYFKNATSDKAVIPVGIDINITDLKSNRVKPVFMANAMYPFHKDPVTSTNGNGDYYESDKQNGTAFLSASGGIAIPLPKYRKLTATVGYSALILKEGYTRSNNTRGMILVSFSAIL